MSLMLCAVTMQIALLAAQPETTVKPALAEPTTAVNAQAVAKTEAATKAEAEAAETYTEAHRITVNTGKPLVVMVGADWCGPCQTMRRSILPRVREHGIFRKVSFAHVNVDRERELATELIGGGAVPQLVMYRKTKDGWTRRKMIGSHSVEEVEQFINEGLAMDTDEHNAETETADQTDGEKQSG